MEKSGVMCKKLFRNKKSSFRRLIKANKLFKSTALLRKNKKKVVKTKWILKLI